jgi:hypothetical protein
MKVDCGVEYGAPAFKQDELHNLYVYALLQQEKHRTYVLYVRKFFEPVQRASTRPLYQCRTLDRA